MYPPNLPMTNPLTRDFQPFFTVPTTANGLVNPKIIKSCLECKVYFVCQIKHVSLPMRNLGQKERTIINEFLIFCCC